MICNSCRERQHVRCIDIDPAKVGTTQRFLDGSTKAWESMKQLLRDGRMYRSCDCLHKVAAEQVAEPATGPAGE